MSAAASAAASRRAATAGTTATATATTTAVSKQRQQRQWNDDDDKKRRGTTATTTATTTTAAAASRRASSSISGGAAINTNGRRRRRQQQQRTATTATATTTSGLLSAAVATALVLYLAASTAFFFAFVDRDAQGGLRLRGFGGGPDSSWRLNDADASTTGAAASPTTSSTTTRSSSSSRVSNNVTALLESFEPSDANWPYAYSYIIGGVDPDWPRYRDYLYGIMVSAYLLKHKYRSRADVFLFVEVYVNSKHEALPANELRLLRQLNVTVVQIPSLPENPTFYHLQLQKFRVLGLVNYRRVLHLDSDVVPLLSLDYLFEYSDRLGVLQENVVVQGPNDPANGGTFMVAPRRGDLQRIGAILRRKERRVRETQQFDRDGHLGWGCRLREWVGTRKSGQGWTFFAADGDQGKFWKYWDGPDRTPPVSLSPFRGSIRCFRRYSSFAPI